MITTTTILRGIMLQRLHAARHHNLAASMARRLHYPGRIMLAD